VRTRKEELELMFHFLKLRTSKVDCLKIFSTPKLIKRDLCVSLDWEGGGCFLRELISTVLSSLMF
jgi:hypothetical protein